MNMAVLSQGVGQGEFLGPVTIRSPRTGEKLEFALFLRADGEHFIRNLTEIEVRVERLENRAGGVDEHTKAALEALLH